MLTMSVQAKGIKITLAGSAITKKKVIPLLPDISCSIKNASLI